MGGCPVEDERRASGILSTSYAEVGVSVYLMKRAHWRTQSESNILSNCFQIGSYVQAGRSACAQVLEEIV